MTKRRKHNRHEETLNRREFLKHLLIGGSIIVGGGIGSLVWKLFTEEKTGTPYERGYEVDPSLLKEVKLDRRGTSISSEEARPIIETGIDYIKNQRRPNPSNPNEIFIPKRVLSVKKYIQQSFLVEPDSKYAQSIMNLSRNALDHALIFWDSPYLYKPNISFFVPMSEDDVPMRSSIDRVDINLCYSFKSRDIVLVNFDYNGRTATFEYVSESTGAGEQTRKATFRVLEKEIALETEESSPVLVSLSSEPVYIVETPPVEVLHHQLQTYTHRNMYAELNRIPRNPDGSVSEDSIVYGVNRWIKFEEILAHAIIKLWLEEYNQYARLNFTKQQIENKVYGPYSAESIDLSKRIVGRIREAIEAYVTKPESLFMS